MSDNVLKEHRTLISPREEGVCRGGGVRLRAGDDSVPPPSRDLWTGSGIFESASDFAVGVWI